MLAGVHLLALGGVALALIAMAVWIALRMRSNPEKRERRRRLFLHLHGRLGDAMLTEATADTLYYTYTVRGVQYAASQDISRLREYLPGEPERLFGVVNLKYAPNNPANSIVVCEEWNGLRGERLTAGDSRGH